MGACWKGSINLEIHLSNTESKVIQNTYRNNNSAKMQPTACKMKISIFQLKLIQ